MRIHLSAGRAFHNGTKRRPDAVPSFGTTGFQVSALGFGGMRLALCGPGAGDIDEPLAVRMLRTAIDAGVNYVDTACGYHDGRSEVVVGQTLRDGY